MRRPLAALGALLCAGAPVFASSLPTPAQAAAPRQRAYVGQRVAAVARAYLGYPYAYRGDTPWTGFSCIGFAHWVYTRIGLRLPESLGAAWAASPHVARWALRPGDLLFYANTVWPGLSHVEVYVGGGLSVGADNFTVGVHLNGINAPYFRAHYVGATRPLAGVW